MTTEEFYSYGTETERYRSLTTPYCKGNVVDVGSGGVPVVAHAIQVELPRAEYEHYHSADCHPLPTSCYQGYANNLPFKDETIDTLYSSHLLEDFLDWTPCLKEWTRVLKRDGTLVILMPEKALWAAELARGRQPNCAHKHEPFVGELSTYAKSMGWVVVKDELTNLVAWDYSLIFVARKL